MDWDSGIMIAYKVSCVYKNGCFPFVTWSGGGRGGEGKLDNLKGIAFGSNWNWQIKCYNIFRNNARGFE